MDIFHAAFKPPKLGADISLFSNLNWDVVNVRGMLARALKAHTC